MSDHFASRCLTIAAIVGLMLGPAAQAVPDRFEQLRSIAVARSLTEAELSDVSTFIEKHPADPRGHFLLAIVYDHDGYVELAQESYERALSLDRKYFEAYFMLAASKLRTGNRQVVANELTKRTLAQFGDDGTYLARVAYLLKTAGQSAASEELLNRAKVVSPQNAEININAAAVSFSEQHYEEAISAADQAIKAGGNAVVDAYLIKAQALQKLNRMNESLQCLEKGYALTQHNAKLSSDYGKLLYARGKYSKALEPLLFALALTAATPSGNNIKFKLLHLFRSLPRAQTNAAVEKVYNSFKGMDQGTILRFALGDLYDALGWHNDAIEQYKIALAENPTYGRGYLRLGMDLELYKRDTKAAGLCYQRAHELDDHDEQIQAHYIRFSKRMKNNSNDLALKLKDWLKTPRL